MITLYDIVTIICGVLLARYIYTLKEQIGHLQDRMIKAEMDILKYASKNNR